MNRKVVTGRKQPSSEEINAHQHFDGIIDGVDGIRRGRRIRISLGAAAATIGALIIGLWPSKGTEDQQVAELGSDGQNPIAVVESHQNLEALYPIPVQFFDIDPTADNMIVTETGALIDIPSGSFSGEENITISFKDLSDPMTVFVSGINMDYDSLRTGFHFQSGGMFEIEASLGSTSVSLADGAAIQVSYPTLTTDEGMNQYRYDVETEEWTYQQPLPIRSLKEVCETHEVDFTSGQADQDMPPAMVDFQAQVEEILSAVPDEPHQASATRYKFHFDFDATDFPELEAYADVMFQAKDSRFKRAFYNKTWESVELRKGKLGYSIVLKDGAFEEQFNVIPVLKKEEYEIAFAQYEEAKEKAQEKVNELAKAQAAHADWIEDIRSRKSEYTFVSRDKGKVVTSRLVADLEESTYYRTFNLPDLGLVNCDKPLQFPKGTAISADFVAQTADGLRRFKQVQLIEMDSPAYISYQMGEYDEFRYRPKKENIVIAADHEGRIAVGVSSLFEGVKIEKGETHQFELMWMNSDIESLDDLKAELSSLTQDYPL